MKSSDAHEVIVVGGGPAGLVAALALAQQNLTVTLLAPKPRHPDRRTTALLGTSVDILRDLGIWNAVIANAAPLRKLRLVDGTRRLVRSPEVLFDSTELDLDAFGYNVENETLLAVLRDAVAATSNIALVEQPVTQLVLESEQVVAAFADGAQHTAKLVVAADGRNSICRAAAGIEMRRRPLPQVAIALNLKHSRPHRDTSTEFHTESGPFTLVPLPGMRSSLVWVCTPADAERVRAASDEELAREIEEKSHSILGAIEINGARGIFPLGVELAEEFAKRRVALVGEAGHVIPPIGAQGLNLGIRDAAAIASVAGDAVRNGGDPGSEAAMQTYDTARRGDVRSRAVAVELLGRSLLTDFLPVHIARGLGLELASRIPMLRKNLMRGGLGASLAPAD